MKRKLAGVLGLLMFFTFSITTVGAFVPPGLEKKGGLPPGIQKRFLQEDVDEKEVKLVKKEYKATIEKVDTEDKRIVIKDGTAYLYLLVSDTAKIELDGKDSRLQELKKNDEVYLKLDKDKTIIEVKGKSIGEKEEVKRIKNAVVKSVDTNKKEIVIGYDKKEVLYKVKDDAIIQINGVDKKLSDIKEDMKVDIKVRDRNILELKVLNEIMRYDGRLIAKYTGGNPIIVLKIDNEERAFNVKKEIVLSKIYVGDSITIDVEEDIVINIIKD